MSNIEKWEKMTSSYMEGLVPLVKHCLECKTGEQWFVDYSVSGLNWAVEARCVDCPVSSCLNVGDKEEWAQGDGSIETTLKVISEIVESLLSWCEQKKTHGACYKLPSMQGVATTSEE